MGTQINIFVTLKEKMEVEFSLMFSLEFPTVDDNI